LAAYLVHFPEGYLLCEAPLGLLKVYDCSLVGFAGLPHLGDFGSAVVAVVWVGFPDLVYFLGFVSSSSLCSLWFSSWPLFLFLDCEVSWSQAGYVLFAAFGFVFWLGFSPVGRFRLLLVWVTMRRVSKA
jgi:hypothetical protein